MVDVAISESTLRTNLCGTTGKLRYFELEFSVSETTTLIDHALSRVIQKDMKGQIAVEVTRNPTYLIQIQKFK